MNGSPGTPARFGYLVYAVVCYALFLATICYAVGFVGNFWQAFGLDGPWFRSMDFGGPPEPVATAIVIDALLLGVFALQHSGMARAGFKRRWTRVVPAPIERSTYVLMASACLALLLWQWRPIGASVLWDFSGSPLGALMIAVSLAGWLTVLSATFMLDHFELFGLRQAWQALRGTSTAPSAFATPGLYRAVRHPIYLGFVLAFWATPIMTLGHLVFAAGTSVYILLGIQLEERDLVHRYGDVYRSYRRRVRMLLPFPRRSGPAG
jgi:methanethiol S-methyltransferase